jgi:hypothetical protein
VICFPFGAYFSPGGLPFVFVVTAERKVAPTR